MGGASITLRVLSTVSSIILARLLDPSDFGIVALAQVLLSTISLFSGLGMGLAVVQSQEDRARVAYQAFAASAAFGFLLFLILITNASFFAGLLGDASIVSVLRWMCWMVLLGALTGVPDALLQKELMFDRVSLCVVVSELVYMGLAIGMAILGFGVWSLVYASLARALVNLLLTWWMSPGWDWLIPKPWDRKLMKNLLRYGIQATGSGVVSFFYSIVDNFIVGRQLGPSQLGFYSKSNDFTTRTSEGFMNVIGLVLFPSYSRMQDEKDRLSRAYVKSLRLISILIIPMSMGMFVTAPEMISTLLGDKWTPMVPAFQVIAFVSMIKALSGTTGALFASTGHPGYNLRAGLCITVILLPLIFLFLGFGIVGVAIAVLIAHIFGFAFNMYQAESIMPRTAVKMLSAIAPASVAAALMVGSVMLAKTLLLGLSGEGFSVASLLILVSIGVIVYSMVLFITQRPLLTEILGLVAGRYRSKQA